MAFTLLSSVLLFWATYPEWQELELYQLLLIFLLALDINGGVIANFTFSTNSYYKEHPKLRLLFIIIHIQPLLVALVLGKYYLPSVLVWIYTIASAIIINACYQHPAQRTIAALTSFGILGFSLFFKTVPTFLFVILVFFLIQMSFSFAVDHFAQRKKDG